MTTMMERASTIEPMSLAEIAKEHGDEGVTNREAVFQVNDLAVSGARPVASVTMLKSLSCTNTLPSEARRTSRLTLSSPS